MAEECFRNPLKSLLHWLQNGRPGNLDILPLSCKSSIPPSHPPSYKIFLLFPLRNSLVMQVFYTTIFHLVYTLPSRSFSKAVVGQHFLNVRWYGVCAKVRGCQFDNKYWTPKWPEFCKFGKPNGVKNNIGFPFGNFDLQSKGCSGIRNRLTDTSYIVQTLETALQGHTWRSIM